MTPAYEDDIVRTAAEGGPLFAQLDDAAKNGLQELASVQRAKSGAVLFRQSEVPDHLIQVVSGLVRMTQRNAEGIETTLRIMRAGDLLGCVAVIKQFPYPASAVVIEDCEMLTWRAPDFLAAMRENVQLMDNALQIIGVRTREMVERVGDLVGKDIERRIAVALLQLADQAGTATAAGYEIRYPVLREDLAKLSGLTYFTVSRALSAWQKQGLLVSGRQRMTILNRQELEAIAERASHR